MRVIAGTARRLPLTAPEGRDTRPTTDRIKETLFNVIQKDVSGCAFLDLFSGSGAIGIEAASRGAGMTYLVEFGKKPLQCIKANLAKTKLEDRVTVLPVEVSYAISKLGRMGITFDIVYMDPPYRHGLEEKVLRILSESGIVHSGTRVIVETSLDTKPDYVDEETYQIMSIKEYKTNQHLFLQVR